MLEVALGEPLKFAGRLGIDAVARRALAIHEHQRRKHEVLRLGRRRGRQHEPEHEASEGAGEPGPPHLPIPERRCCPAVLHLPHC